MKRIFRGAIIAAFVAVPLWATSAVGTASDSSLKRQQPTEIVKDTMTPRPLTMAIVASGLLAMVGAGWVRRRRRRREHPTDAG
jgi:LPXTG-motif cell wall-anchored protein